LKPLAPTDDLPPRVLALDGAVNCRDIGGYGTVDGRRVRWRQVWRSDAPSRLSATDRHALQQLRLCTVIDLRHSDERALEPSSLADDDALSIHAIGFAPRAAHRMLGDLRENRPITPETARSMMLELYHELPRDHAQAYARMFRLLIAPDALPAMVHCTSGKDRTGFGIALLLCALGVPRETVLEDYLLTNRYRRDIGAILQRRVDPEVLDVVVAAHTEYLDAAFDSIREHHGSVEQFLGGALGLDRRDLAALQERLLESL
jgi:protein-tyrosine phosphatase